MAKLLRILVGLAILGVVALLAFIFVPLQRTAPNQQLPADWKPQPGAGEYMARASDCVACHTAPEGQAFAGGLAINSPMGTIWSTNITPDKETGIGNWTLEDFRAAMVDGVAPNGSHLYPAMPYENYRLMKEEDIRALYDYFMNEVKPVKQANHVTALEFPFNMRFGIRAWNWISLGPDQFTPTQKTAIEDRGQYLVEGPAHCAACHSPRTAFMAQDGVVASDPAFLTGGVVDGWNAPSLRGPESAPQKWTVGDMASYLATGRNAFSTANGEMGMVVDHSLQYLTDDDNIAIAAFLKGMDGAPVEVPTTFATLGPIATPAAPADAAGKATAEMLTAANPDLALGPQLYLDNCSACHFVTGKGAPDIFPELQGNNMVIGSEVRPLISVILNGATVHGTFKRPMDLVMQGYADRLTDDEIAELSTFLRSAWGNDAGPVTAADVTAVRAKSSAH